MLNHIDIQGRLTKDPELRTTQSGTSVVTFTLAVDRDFQKDTTDFFSCVAWRQTAEFVSKYFSKGQLMVASGKMQSRKWQDRDGDNRTAWEVQAENVYFGDSKKSDGYSGGEHQYTAPKAPNVYVDASDDGDELPF